MPQPFILTTGEPAGIGPDICIQSANFLRTHPVVLCGDIELLRERAAIHSSDVQFHHYDAHKTAASHSIPVHHTPLKTPAQPRTLDVRNAQYVLNTLTIAARETQAGKYSGIITAPIHKGIICESGVNFSGHTEFFADITNAPLPVMVLATRTLKVGLITTHIPLMHVPQAITRERLTQILTIIDHDMRKYFTKGVAPKIGVCGLNPHAGESGHMGDEEITVINPTLNALRDTGIVLSDALPADTLFVPKHAHHYDIIVAMYHDQGLPVIKSQGFGECVNITFGLPLIRTSVDHGTALDLAGTAKADPSSLQCAVELAQHMYTA